MNKSMSSLLILGTAGYFLYKKRYRLMNVLIGTGWVRKAAVNTFMGMPGVRNRMMESVFGEPDRH